MEHYDFLAEPNTLPILNVPGILLRELGFFGFERDVFWTKELNANFGVAIENQITIFREIFAYGAGKIKFV